MLTGLLSIILLAAGAGKELNHNPNPNPDPNRTLNLNSSLSKMAIYLLSPLSKFPGLTFSLPISLHFSFSFLFVQYPCLRSLLQVIGDPQLMLPLSRVVMYCLVLSWIPSPHRCLCFCLVLGLSLASILSRLVLSCRVVSCRSVSYRVVSCRVLFLT